MILYLPHEHSRGLTNVINGVLERYTGQPKELLTNGDLEAELVSEVYKYLYVENGLKYFPVLRKDLKDVAKLMDPDEEDDYLEARTIDDTAPPQEITVKGTFV
jgi:hypothetical protein